MSDKPARRRISLRVQNLIIVIAPWLAIFAYSFVFQNLYKQVMQNLFERQGLFSSRTLARYVRFGVLSEDINVLEVLVRNFAGGEMEGQSRDIKTVAVYNAKGRLLVQSDQGGKTPVDQSFLDQLFQTAESRCAVSQDHRYILCGAPVDKDSDGAAGKPIGFVAIRFSLEKAQRELNDLTRIGYVILLFILVVSVGLSYWLMGKFLKPLDHLLEVSRNIAQGNLRQEVSVRARNELADLGDSTKEMIDRLHETISRIMDSSGNVAAASSNISASAEKLAQGAENQARQTQETSSAIEEMSASVQLVYENSISCLKSSESAAETAEKGGEVVVQAVDSMARIESSVAETAGLIDTLRGRSEEIGKIVEVIESIAAQTNLLALNAAIEAARAGEHGRGFEVVAEEIRKLAEKSGESTKEISSIIGEIQRETKLAHSSMTSVSRDVGEGTGLVSRAGDSLKEIIDSISRTTEMMKAMADAADQQAKVSDQVSLSVNNIAFVTTENAAAAEEIAATSAQLAQLADVLQNLVAKFKV